MVKKRRTTHTSNTAPDDHPRVEVGHKLEENHKERLQLAAQWNSLTPAGCLPEELLLEIFTICAQGRFSYSPPKIFYRWLSITWVCRRWRRVALGAPSLWRNIQMTKTPLVKLFLARSREMSLNVAGRIQISYTRDCLKGWRSIASVLHRIRHLDLSAEPSFGAWDCLAHYKIENPNFSHLESLSISVKGKICSTAPKLLSDARELPSLKTLELSHLDFAVARRFLVPSLKTLILREYADPRALIPLGWAAFIDGLSKLKNLVSLDVTPLPHPPFHFCPEDQRLILPALRDLRVELRHTAIPSATLLSYLEFTPTKIDFSVGTMHRNEAAPPLYVSNRDDMAYLGTMLRRALVKENVAPIVKFRINPNWSWGEQVEFYIYGETKVSSDSHDDTLLHLAIESYTPAAIVKDLVAALPLQHVQYLEITQWPEDDPDSIRIEESSWRRACSDMKEVEFLHIGSLSVQNLLRCICPSADFQPLFPKLHTILMDDVDFTLKATVEWIKFLKDLLQARVDANMRIKKLIIQRATNFIEADANGIRGLVDTLEWDGSVNIPVTAEADSDVSSINTLDLAEISDEEIETDL